LLQPTVSAEKRLKFTAGTSCFSLRATWICSGLVHPPLHLLHFAAGCVQVLHFAAV
jgi:hypothetical protein